MDVMRIALLGISGVFLGIFLKEIRPEYAMYISLAVGICILLAATGRLLYVFEMLGKLKGYIPVESTYLDILVKMIGITYVGQFSAGLCKDAGYQAVAGQIELFAKLSILVLSMPVLLALLETIQEFLV